jgi:hypothetical protein
LLKPISSTIEAILHHTIKGLDTAGQLRDVKTTLDGAVYVHEPPFVVPKRAVPGIGTAAAYASGDAFGTKFFFDVPREGVITQFVFLDYDDEGITKELVLFNADFTATADNSAFAPSDDDLAKCMGVISIDVFYNFDSNQVGIAVPAFSYNLPSGRFYAQFVTRGADNIAAGSIPEFLITVI